jgi:hypothetical protein
LVTVNVEKSVRSSRDSMTGAQLDSMASMAWLLVECLNNT